jgi:hypothetical protein
MPDVWAAFRETIGELPEHWDDSYWWADHWWLQIMIAGLLAAGLDMTAHYLKLSMTRSMLPEVSQCP